jgi:CBS domain-containing protein
MEIELVEIRDFVAEHHPFDLLSEEQLDQIPEQIEVRYLRRGNCFPPADNDGQYLYMVRTGAIDLRDLNDQLVGKLAEGDLYSTECQLVEVNESSCHKVIEDCLLYQMPCSFIKRLRDHAEEFYQHFEADLTQRLQRAARYSDREANLDMASMTIEIGKLIKKDPVTVDSSATIQQVAGIMSEFNVSSIIITDNDQLAGILTDRDLRRRCVAKALDVQQPVTQIMTPDPHTMHSKDLVLHALMTMTKQGFNHLPIVDDGVIRGMLTATDLTRHSSGNPVFMNSQINKSNNVDELRRISERLPSLQVLLANTSIQAKHAGETISCITDGLTIRLIELAQQELGPAPVPFVWVAGGSQARLEQTSHSDQDNAMIISDDVRSTDMGYFEQLANRVCDGLDACGFYYCPGDAMASNPKWRQPLNVWKRYFKDWIKKPDPMALMLSSIFFDLRPVHGDFSLHKKLQKKILKLSRKNTLFIAHMANNALTHRPPLGFFRTLVLIHDGEHDKTFDIKHRGIVPITDIARVLALAEGIKRVNTSERLAALSSTSSMSAEMSASLRDALEFIASLRISHQAEQIRSGKPTNNYLPPGVLSSLERKHLKDAFEIIKDAQESLENRYQMA